MKAVMIQLRKTLPSQAQGITMMMMMMTGTPCLLLLPHMIQIQQGPLNQAPLPPQLVVSQYL